MNYNNNNKKILAEKIKAKLNSPEYVAMSDLITYDDRYSDMLTWLWGKKEDWISGTNINPGKGNKHESEHIIYYDELEKDDWEEIVNLIEKRKKEKEWIYEQKRENIKEKLNNTPNLYYRFSTSKRISTSYFVYPDKHGEYFSILGMENGREYFLNININHPVLNDFPWEKNGYYLIETDKKIERNDKFGRPWSDYGESNPSNFHKWVEVGDEITITPYEVADKSVEKQRKNDSPKENNQIAGGKNNNSNQSIEKLSSKEEKKIIDYLTQYFKDNQIKKITFENDKLMVNHNDNNADSQITNNSEYQLIKNSLQKIDKNELSSQELGLSSNNNFTPTQNPNNGKTTWWLIGGSIILVTFGIVVGILLSKKKKKH